MQIKHKIIKLAENGISKSALLCTKTETKVQVRRDYSLTYIYNTPGLAVVRHDAQWPTWPGCGCDVSTWCRHRV